MISQIRKIGNSLGNIIPNSFIKELNINENTKIDIQLKSNAIIIKPIKEKKIIKLTERELLNEMTAYTAHADEIALISDMELSEK